ncbi:MAG: aminoacyl--tRNA ligase-related protein [bacterium]|nr:aminoacyl--tRNA ligase-related protein [bacterium]
MRYADLFGATRREAPRDIESINGQLLYRGGFVDQTAAGIYTWLPLGVRVLERVERIVREEMAAVGAQEIIMPKLHPKEYWEQTGRWDRVDVLFKLESRTGKSYALGASHEEIVTPLAQKFIHSYRDLPKAVYQIQTKFRDELRAKGGVLRGREFGMKDCYSFHATREDFLQYYDQMLVAYRRVFERCGLTATRVRASGGDFTENISDEFHVETPSGEDTLRICDACRIGVNVEIAATQQACSTCGGALRETTGIEVGNTFDIDTKYSGAINFTYTDEAGVAQPVIMGCYGIGTTRLVGAIVEAHHDEAGIRWPASVAPLAAHVVVVVPRDAEKRVRVMGAAQDLMSQLSHAGIEALLDDREDTSTGAKFADADLIGIPVRIVVSDRALGEGGVEVKYRDAAEGSVQPRETVVAALVEAKGRTH